MSQKKLKSAAKSAAQQTNQKHSIFGVALSFGLISALSLSFGAALLPHSARAESPSDVSAEASTGLKLNSFVALFDEVKTARDITRLPLSEKNRQTLLEEVRSKRFQFEKPMLEQNSDSRLDLKFKDSTVTLDFRDLGKNVVYVGSKKIELRAEKSYFVYRNEVGTALASKTSIYNLIVGDNAYAEDAGQTRKDTSASVLTSLAQWLIGDSKKSAERSVEKTLRDYYNAKEQFWLSGNENANEGDPTTAFFRAPSFTCKAGKLETVSQVVFVENGKRVRKVESTLTANANGHIVSKANAGIEKFGLLANACCDSSRPACEKNVKAHIAAIADDMSISGARPNGSGGKSAPANR